MPKACLICLVDQENSFFTQYHELTNMNFYSYLKFSLIACFLIFIPVEAQEKTSLASLIDDYEYLHRKPELSYQEKETSAFLQKKMEDLGFEVTPNVGGYGLVALMKNGDGPTVMIRTDMDALPLKEETGKSYASTQTGLDDDGNEVPAMHACGHDVHMTVWLGTAEKLLEQKNQWSGTLMMIAQPAEERGNGAEAMLADGLFERFPLPDYCLALHVNSSMEAGKVGVCPGFALASVDMVDITVFGKGGHGAYPHKTVDPIVLAARMILDFQTIVSREIAPTEPAVVTVGSIHGGTKHNIIPSEVKLQLTLRSYSDDVRKHSIEALHRICDAVSASAGLEEDLYPKIVLTDEAIPATFNDPTLSEKCAEVFRNTLGSENVLDSEPVMGGEDFGLYSKTKENIPGFLFWLGAVSREDFADHQANGTALPSIHSPFFAPDAEPTISTGVKTMTAAALDLFDNK